MRTASRTITAIAFTIATLSVALPTEAHAEDACMELAAKLCITCGAKNPACRYVATQAVLTHVASTIAENKDFSAAAKASMEKDAGKLLKACVSLSSVVAEATSDELMCRVMSIAAKDL